MCRDRTAARTFELAFLGERPGERFAEHRIIRGTTTTCSALLVAISTLRVAPALADDPKREVPDYDGRGNVEADADSWPLWIPRVLLAPAYAVNEYVFRRPLGALVRKAERDHWADSVERIFTFGEGDKQLIIPTALFDFGLLPSVGAYYSGSDMFTTGNELRLHGAGWGASWINVTASDRYAIDARNTVEVRGEFRRAEDNIFFGIGPDVKQNTQSRYGLERIEGAARYHLKLAGESRLDLHGGIHRIAFVGGSCCGDPELADRIASGDLMAPPGYGEGYTATFAGADLAVDSRSPRPEPGSGTYLRVHGRASYDLDAPRSWLQYGGVLGGAVDLTGHQRIVKMQLALDFVDPLQGSGDSIPFTEYAVLGGELMPGFISGWMTGRSTAAAQIGYTWPVWLGLDGQARFTIGNAFDQHLDGLSPRKLRMSGDFGFTTASQRDQGFEVLVGLGTETFEQGADITSVRVTFGSRQGF